MWLKFLTRGHNL